MIARGWIHWIITRSNPFLSEEACHYLVEIGVKLVGFDAPTSTTQKMEKEASRLSKPFITRK